MSSKPQPAYPPDVQEGGRILFREFMKRHGGKQTYRHLLSGTEFHFVDNDWNQRPVIVLRSGNSAVKDTFVAKRTAMMMRGDLQNMIGTNLGDTPDEKKLVGKIPVPFDVEIVYKESSPPLSEPAPAPDYVEHSLITNEVETLPDDEDTHDDVDDENTPSLFNGFLPISANFTRTPNQFFTDVIPNAKPTVTCLVAVVIHNTCGYYNADHQTSGRVWWPTTVGWVAKESGMYRTSCVGALQDARESGYIVVEKLTAERAQVLKMQFNLDYIPTINICLRGINKPADLS